MRILIAHGIVTLTLCAAYGQGADARLTFEVASIKPAAPPTDGRIMVMMRGGPGDRNDPGRVNWVNVSIRDMLRTAYDVRDYQITGPDWLNGTRFDVTAKLPQSTTKEQYAVMWQNLLKDRFGMVMHRESKELPAYGLVVAKGGPKMPKAQEDPPTGDGEAPAIGGGAGGAKFGPGGPGGPIRNGMVMMRGMGHMEAKGVPMTQLVNMLSNLLDRPVVDETALTGNWDIKLDYTPDESTNGMMAKARAMGAMPMPRPDGGEGRGPAEGVDGGGVSLFTAVQAQLGLKLESKKLPLDMVVIDRIEKAPTEN